MKRPDVGTYSRFRAWLVRRWLVRPFYVKMSGVGATEYLPELRRALALASMVVTAKDVLWLLGSEQSWREQVAGAWFALAVPEDEVRDAVVSRLSEATGEDTAEPLAVVATLLAGAGALDAMHVCLGRSAGRPQDNSFEIVAAGVVHLGGRPPVLPAPSAVEWFEQLLNAALDVQLAFRTARAWRR